MQDFQFYVTDDRYEVPSLLLVTLVDRGSAQRIAERILSEPHHQAVEVWDRNQRILTLHAAAPSKA